MFRKPALLPSSGKEEPNLVGTFDLFSGAYLNKLNVSVVPSG